MRRSSSVFPDIFRLCRTAAATLMVFFAWSLTAPHALQAQFTASIEGRVTDPSEAAVPNAQVVVENTATGVRRTVTTSSEGYYRVPSLPASAYTVRVTASGFQTHVTENV